MPTATTCSPPTSNFTYAFTTRDAAAMEAVGRAERRWPASIPAGRRSPTAKR